MKYLKSTIILFIVTFTFVTVSAKAINTNPVVVNINDIKIPILKQKWISEQYVKINNTHQYVTKTDCVDSLSGDGRAIQANVHSLLHGVGDSGFIDIPKGDKVNMGTVSKNLGNWQLQLKSKKSFVTTARFWGVWVVD